MSRSAAWARRSGYAPTFDLAHHVRELPLEAPIGEAELLLAVEQLRRQRLDPSRPLWEMWFLTALPERQVGLFVKIHHTIGDGMAAMTTVTAFLDRASDVPEPSLAPWRPTPWPSARELLADNVARHVQALAAFFSPLLRPWSTVRRLRQAWPAIRELLAEEPATPTSLDRMVGPDRSLALVRTSLASVKAIGHAHDATVNDVLLAATASGLRTLLRRRGEPVENATVRIYVPVSLRRRWRGPQQGNQIAQMAVPLCLGESDPVRRLRHIAGETTQRKARARSSLGSLMHGGRLGRRLMLAAVMRQRVNATSASIPGPRQPLSLAGARILEVFPILPLVANGPLGIGAVSYAGTLNIGISADRDAYPDLDVFATAVRDDLHVLALTTRVPLPPVPAGESSAGAPGLVSPAGAPSAPIWAQAASEEG